MKLKYHKIRGVDLQECTAEQKIAYNMAWRLNGRYGDKYRIVAKNYPVFVTLDLRDEMVQEIVKEYQIDYSDSKYNIDAIFAALMYGLHDYLIGTRHIFTSYEEIGKAFPAHYLNA